MGARALGNPALYRKKGLRYSVLVVNASPSKKAAASWKLGTLAAGVYFGASLEPMTKIHIPACALGLWDAVFPHIFAKQTRTFPPIVAVKSLFRTPSRTSPRLHVAKKAGPLEPLN